MNQPRCSLSWPFCVSLSCFLLSAPCGWPQVVALTNAIQPTVTIAMGDVGGKYFGQPPDPAKTRHYYLAAEPELWNYLPQGRDVICGMPVPLPISKNARGGKLRYVQYSDETFASKLIETPRLGILGPVLRGSVGEYLAVTFLNRSWRPLSLHPHGLKYDKDSEGSYDQAKPGLGAAVAPGAKFTYVWYLDESSGPLPGEPSSKGWLYHSHVNAGEEINLGLIGFSVVTDPKRARPDGTPSDVDREMAALFMIFDESGLGQAEKEAAEYGNAPNRTMQRKTWAQTQEILQQSARHAINGYIFGNLPGLEMNEGERVRWYLFGLGSEEDFHTAHWHGLRVAENGRRRTDVIELLPATMKVADMVADNPGTWLFHCHVAEHMMEGMFARVVVHAKGAPGASRDPDQAFFGLRKAQQTLQIKRAEALLDWSPGAAKPCELRFEGRLTVYEAFSVFTESFQLQVQEKSFAFKVEPNGVARTAEGLFRVKNASPEGVVYGGVMEFEAVLSGANWLLELKKLGVTGASSTVKEVVVSLTIKVGNSRHTATVPIVVQTK